MVSDEEEDDEGPGGSGGGKRSKHLPSAFVWEVPSWIHALSLLLLLTVEVEVRRLTVIPSAGFPIDESRTVFFFPFLL